MKEVTLAVLIGDRWVIMRDLDFSSSQTVGYELSKAGVRIKWWNPDRNQWFDSYLNG